MSGKNIGFGILGSGMAARLHQAAIAGNIDQGAGLVAVSTRDSAKYRSAGEEFGVPCLPYQDLLGHPDVDAVCICTPSGLHARQALEAAEAGKHVLVEKPMALSLADAEAMIRAFDRKGLCLGVAYQRRAEALFRDIYRLIQSGGIGDITTGLVTVPYQRTKEYYGSAPWRGTWELDGGGALMNQGIHLIDLLVWYAGPPAEVKAMGGALVHDIEVEDTLGACVRFENGAIITITATTAATPGYPHRLELYGNKGGLQIEGATIIRGHSDLAIWVNRAHETRREVEAGSGAAPTGIKIDGHVGLVANFCRAVRGEEELYVDGREGRRSLALVLEIYRQAGLR